MSEPISIQSLGCAYGTELNVVFKHLHVISLSEAHTKTIQPEDFSIENLDQFTQTIGAGFITQQFKDWLSAGIKYTLVKGRDLFDQFTSFLSQLKSKTCEYVVSAWSRIMEILKSMGEHVMLAIPDPDSYSSDIVGMLKALRDFSKNLADCTTSAELYKLLVGPFAQKIYSMLKGFMSAITTLARVSKSKTPTGTAVDLLETRAPEPQFSGDSGETGDDDETEEEIEYRQKANDDNPDSPWQETYHELDFLKRNSSSSSQFNFSMGKLESFQKQSSSVTSDSPDADIDLLLGRYFRGLIGFVTEDISTIWDWLKDVAFNTAKHFFETMLHWIKQLGETLLNYIVKSYQKVVGCLWDILVTVLDPDFLFADHAVDYCLPLILYGSAVLSKQFDSLNGSATRTARKLVSITESLVKPLLQFVDNMVSAAGLVSFLDIPEFVEQHRKALQDSELSGFPKDLSIHNRFEFFKACAWYQSNAIAGTGDTTDELELRMLSYVKEITSIPEVSANRRYSDPRWWSEASMIPRASVLAVRGFYGSVQSLIQLERLASWLSLNLPYRSVGELGESLVGLDGNLVAFSFKKACQTIAWTASGVPAVTTAGINYVKSINSASFTKTAQLMWSTLWKLTRWAWKIAGSSLLVYVSGSTAPALLLALGIPVSLGLERLLVGMSVKIFDRAMEYTHEFDKKYQQSLVRSYLISPQLPPKNSLRTAPLFQQYGAISSMVKDTVHETSDPLQRKELQRLFSGFERAYRLLEEQLLRDKDLLTSLPEMSSMVELSRVMLDNKRNGSFRQQLALPSYRVIHAIFKGTVGHSTGYPLYAELSVARSKLMEYIDSINQKSNPTIDVTQELPNGVEFMGVGESSSKESGGNPANDILKEMAQSARNIGAIQNSARKSAGVDDVTRTLESLQKDITSIYSEINALAVKMYNCLHGKSGSSWIYWLSHRKSQRSSDRYIIDTTNVSLLPSVNDLRLDADEFFMDPKIYESIMTEVAKVVGRLEDFHIALRAGVNSSFDTATRLRDQYSAFYDHARGLLQLTTGAGKVFSTSSLEKSPQRVSEDRLAAISQCFANLNQSHYRQLREYYSAMKTYSESIKQTIDVMAGYNGLLLKSYYYSEYQKIGVVDIMTSFMWCTANIKLVAYAVSTVARSFNNLRNIYAIESGLKTLAKDEINSYQSQFARASKHLEENVIKKSFIPYDLFIRHGQTVATDRAGWIDALFGSTLGIKEKRQLLELQESPSGESFTDAVRDGKGYTSVFIADATGRYPISIGNSGTASTRGLLTRILSADDLVNLATSLGNYSATRSAALGMISQRIPARTLLSTMMSGLLSTRNSVERGKPSAVSFLVPLGEMETDPNVNGFANGFVIDWSAFSLVQERFFSLGSKAIIDTDSIASKWNRWVSAVMMSGSGPNFYGPGIQIIIDAAFDQFCTAYQMLTLSMSRDVSPKFRWLISASGKTIDPRDYDIPEVLLFEISTFIALHTVLNRLDTEVMALIQDTTALCVSAQIDRDFPPDDGELQLVATNWSGDFSALKFENLWATALTFSDNVFDAVVLGSDWRLFDKPIQWILTGILHTFNPAQWLLSSIGDAGGYLEYYTSGYQLFIVGASVGGAVWLTNVLIKTLMLFWDKRFSAWTNFIVYVGNLQLEQRISAQRSENALILSGVNHFFRLLPVVLQFIGSKLGWITAGLSGILKPIVLTILRWTIGSIVVYNALSSIDFDAVVAKILDKEPPEPSESHANDADKGDENGKPGEEYASAGEEWANEEHKKRTDKQIHEGIKEPNSSFNQGDKQDQQEDTFKPPSSSPGEGEPNRSDSKPSSHSGADIQAILDGSHVFDPSVTIQNSPEGLETLGDVRARVTIPRAGVSGDSVNLYWVGNDLCFAKRNASGQYVCEKASINVNYSKGVKDEVSAVVDLADRVTFSVVTPRDGWSESVQGVPQPRYNFGDYPYVDPTGWNRVIYSTETGALSRYMNDHGTPESVLRETMGPELAEASGKLWEFLKPDSSAPKYKDFAREFASLVLYDESASIQKPRTSDNIIDASELVSMDRIIRGRMQDMSNPSSNFEYAAASACITKILGPQRIDFITDPGNKSNTIQFKNEINDAITKSDLRKKLQITKTITAIRSSGGNQQNKPEELQIDLRDIVDRGKDIARGIDKLAKLTEKPFNAPLSSHNTRDSVKVTLVELDYWLDHENREIAFENCANLYSIAKAMLLDLMSPPYSQLFLLQSRSKVPFLCIPLALCLADDVELTNHFGCDVLSDPRLSELVPDVQLRRLVRGVLSDNEEIASYSRVSISAIVEKLGLLSLPNAGYAHVNSIGTLVRNSLVYMLRNLQSLRGAILSSLSDDEPFGDLDVIQRRKQVLLSHLNLVAPDLLGIIGRKQVSMGAIGVIESFPHNY